MSKSRIGFYFDASNVINKTGAKNYDDLGAIIEESLQKLFFPDCATLVDTFAYYNIIEITLHPEWIDFKLSDLCQGIIAYFNTHKLEFRIWVYEYDPEISDMDQIEYQFEGYKNLIPLLVNYDMCEIIESSGKLTPLVNDTNWYPVIHKYYGDDL